MGPKRKLWKSGTFLVQQIFFKLTRFKCTSYLMAKNVYELAHLATLVQRATMI